LCEVGFPATGGTLQITNQTQLPDNEYNPTDDASALPPTATDKNDAASENNATGAASGSPNMEPDVNNYGNGDSLGNNDGTEPSPEMNDSLL